MSLAQLLAAGFTADLAIEAVRLLHKVVATLEIAQDNGESIVCAFVATPEMHDALCAFAAFDDREPEGLEEEDARNLPRSDEASPVPAPAPRLDVVAPVGTRWLKPPPWQGAPAEKAGEAPEPVTPIESVALNVSALLKGSGRHPRGAADWYRLQGAGRLRSGRVPPPPIMVPVAGVCVA